MKNPTVKNVLDTLSQKLTDEDLYNLHVMIDQCIVTFSAELKNIVKKNNPDYFLNKEFLPKERKPHVGEYIYIPTALYIDDDSRDRSGGITVIESITLSTSAGNPTWFVTCVGIDGNFNYSILMENQDKYRSEYKNQKAKMDRDR